MLAALITVVLSTSALYGFMRWFEWRHIFKPERTMEADPGKAGLPFEDVWFVAEDGCRLHGWWIPHPDANGTVLYCHGNAGNISTRMDVCTGLHSLGVHVFIFDYRGYGRSRGIAGEQGLYRDARAAFEVVRARHGDVEDPPVIVYGASLGGAVAAHLVTEKPARGLVLEGTFNRSVEVGKRWYPWLPIRAISSYRFDSQSKLATLAMPKLFAHSPEDEVIPCDLGAKLYASAAGPKRFVTLSGAHGEAGWMKTPLFLTELRRFVGETLGSPSPNLK